MNPKEFQTQCEKDCDWAFGLNRKMLNYLGIWPSDDYNVIYLKELRAPFMLLWIVMILLLPEIYALVKVYPDLTLIIDNIIVSCADLLSLAKLFIIWYNRKAFEPLIHCMRADWSREKPVLERDLMLKQAQRGRLFTMAAAGIMTATISCFIVSPIIGIDLRIVNNITDLHERRYMPVQSFYPYNFTKSPNFELTYASQLIAASFAAVSFTAADSFFGVLVFHAAGQCEILSAKLVQLFDCGGASFDGKMTFKTKLCRIVNMHVYLVQFVVRIERSFNILVLSHSLGLSIAMCCVGFEVANSLKNESSSPPILQIVILSMAMLDSMLHMLIYCSATEILTSNSESFIRAAYSSNWYSSSAKYSRDVIPLMMRSQYPFQLTVGKFFYLSLNLYVKILKTSAGFISMLLAVK